MNTLSITAEIMDFNSEPLGDEIMLKMKLKSGHIRMIISKKMADSLITSLQGDLFNMDKPWGSRG